MLVYIFDLNRNRNNFGALLCACFNFVTGSKKLGFQFCKFYAAIGVGSNFFVYSLHFPTILKASFQIHLKP